MSTRTALLAIHERADSAIEYAHAAMLRDLAPELARFYREYAAKQAESEEGDVPTLWLYEHNRLPSLLRRVYAEVNAFGEVARATTEQAQHAAIYEAAQEAEGLPEKPDTSALVGQSTMTGKPLVALTGGFGAEASQRVQENITASLHAGSSPLLLRTLVRLALDRSRMRARVIARTEQYTAYREALRMALAANPKLISGWQWSASSDACPFCQSMDGTIHGTGEGMETHPNCRCTLRPLDASGKVITDLRRAVYTTQFVEEIT